MKKSTQISIIAAFFVLLLGWKQLRDRDGRADTEQPAANRVAIAAAAKSFRIGMLDFSACNLAQRHSSAVTPAFCAPFSVPEDRSKPDGRRIDMRLALLKADDPVADGFVVFLAGGPGQSAVDGWPQVAPALAPLRRNRHIVLLDQRGVGGSNALNCDALPEDGEFNLDLIDQRTRDCLAKVSAHADPAQYTTTAAVADLEALRLALGGPTFDLVGVSYGTRVAQQYLMRHPDGVRSVVLDSVAPNSLVFGHEFARNLDDALNAQFAACTATPACKDAFGDPRAKLLQLRDQLRANPQAATLRDPVDFSEQPLRLDDNVLAAVVRLYAYTPETAALLPLTINEALKGNTAPLLGQARMIFKSTEELANSGMQISVVCAEDADRLKSDPPAEGTLLGNLMVDVMQRQCAIWPKGARPADFNADLISGKPVLVLAGELDPVTPPRYADEVMKGLGNAKQILAKGQGHNVIGRGCIPSLVQQFVKDLDPKSLDTACADRLVATPAFIRFSGANP